MAAMMHATADAADLLGTKYAGRRYLRTHEIIDIGLVSNRRTLANLVARGDLPQPIRLGRLLLFPVDELACRLAAARKRTSPTAE
jgi:hypothetical protein